MNRHHHREQGSAAIETVIGFVGLSMLISLIILGGRITLANNAVDAAANEAARTASIARTAAVASATAKASARDTLANQGLKCHSISVTVNTGGFNATFGTQASVTARVACVVDLTGVSIPGVARTRTVRASASSPIDTYRTR